VGSIRIIAGSLRGRKLQVPELPNLRPTPDRVRVTLFNWLGRHLLASRCLDLFAGSGVLAIESLSRGAAKVVIVDSARLAVSTIKKNCARLKLSHLDFQVHQQKADDYLISSLKPFNIIYLDPPYKENILHETLSLILEKNLLLADGLIYLETDKSLTDALLPDSLEYFKTKSAGMVNFALVCHKGSR